MTVWFVASGSPGTSSFLEMEAVAVNFYVRSFAGGLPPNMIKEEAAGRHPTWDAKSAATKTLFANQLARFASEIDVDDQVITFEPADRQTIVVGRVTRGYQYQEPSPIVGHPHLLPVEWLGTLDRGDLPDMGAAIPRTRNVTVKCVYQRHLTPTRLLDDEPPVSGGPVQPVHRTLESHQPRTPDGFIWEPTTGEHRYTLRQTFGRWDEVRRPFLVVMLNPGANHLEGFRRSTTCHAVRRWGLAHGYDGAIYLNLFTHIEPNSARLQYIPLHELNGPAADVTIGQVGRDVGGLAIAGWGNLPPGLQRSRYDARVAQVRELLGMDLVCLGLTRAGYPRHGRGWRSDDATARLR